MSLTIKVMSYNIHYGVDNDGRLNLRSIADVIREEDPDLVGLQEVDRHWSERSGFIDEAGWLSGCLGMRHVFAANLERDPPKKGAPRRQYGTAVLSKYPITRAVNYKLSSFGMEQRGLLETCIDVAGTCLHFYNVHLGLTEQQRDRQVSEILSVLKSSCGLQILAGDLNAQPDSKELRRLLDGFLHDALAGDDEAFTFPALKPNRRIDYILYSSGIKVDGARVVEAAVSDHRPVVALCTFENAGKGKNWRDRP